MYQLPNAAMAITTLRICPDLQEKIKSDQIRLELYANRPTAVILSIFGCFIATGSQSNKVATLTWKGRVLKQNLQ